MGSEGSEGREATSRRDSPSGFSSVPGHCTLLAGILFTHTHTHISMQRQMTINGCDNVVCVLSLFSGGGGGCTATCFVFCSRQIAVAW